MVDAVPVVLEAPVVEPAPHRDPLPFGVEGAKLAGDIGQVARGRHGYGLLKTRR
jgi:hypothetical protein